MKFRFLKVCFMLMLVLSSCEHNDENLVETSDNEDFVTMKFSFSLPNAIESGTEYTPMRSATRGSDDIDITISNRYKVLIAKKMGSKWIIDKMFETCFDPTDTYDLKRHRISDIAPLFNFTTDLRPGEYQMTIFTGSRSVEWNEDLEVGAIVQDMGVVGSNPIYACTYRTVDNGFLNVGERCLQEEIFSGMKHFIVEKTNDLHSESLVEENSIKLNRRVAKMRILLKKEPQGSEDFYQDLNDGIGISAHLQAEAGHEFCYGLDVWGEPCYGESTIAYMKYGAFTWPRYQAASDGNEYMLAMRDARQFASYYFMDPKKDVPVTVSNVEVSGTQGLPIFECLDYIRTITLKYNHITGIAFKSNSNDSWNGGMRLGMELITESDGISPVDASEIFSNNHDYKSK